jgi:hypothetical protein
LDFGIDGLNRWKRLGVVGRIARCYGDDGLGRFGASGFGIVGLDELLIENGDLDMAPQEKLFSHAPRNA